MPVFDKNTARIKMVAFTKNGVSKNTRWYSLEKYNTPSASDEKIINGMLNRLKQKPEIMNVLQKVVFYDNKTDQPIKEFDGW